MFSNRKTEKSSLNPDSNRFELLLPSDEVSDVVEEGTEDDVVGAAGLLGVLGSLLGVLQLGHLLTWQSFFVITLLIFKIFIFFMIIIWISRFS